MVNAPVVSAFPWSTLITAVSTLGAGLGGAGLTNRYNLRNQDRQFKDANEAKREERLRQAYGDLLVGGRQLLGNLGQMRVFYSSDQNDPAAGALNSRMDSRCDQVSKAAALVDLLGSAPVRAAEQELAASSLVFTSFRVRAEAGQWQIDTPGGYDGPAIEAAEQRLTAAIDTYAEAARGEIASAIGPPPVG